MKSCFVGGQRVRRRCDIVSSEVQRFAMCLRYVYVVVHLNSMAYTRAEFCIVNHGRSEIFHL